MSANAPTAAAPRRALLSVSDKTGLAALARGLHAAGIELLSTGGTAAYLSEQGLPVTAISDLTGFPEIMGGRVKTLHPAIHGGILGRRDVDAAVMREHGIQGIDIVVVNLYPFQATIARPGCSRAQAVEQIDIGGPAMIRAAAKNHAWVSVVVDPADYPQLLATLPQGPNETRRRAWAAKAYAHTAEYDAAISMYLSQDQDLHPSPDPATAGDATQPAEVAAPLPPLLLLPLCRQRVLRYGENPHQQAAVYTPTRPRADTLAGAQPLQGKPLSYNNLLDADAAWRLVRSWQTESACVIVKHGNPCGAAVSDNIAHAYEQALACDAQSAFGGIIAFNQTVDESVAHALAKHFVEVIIAPGFTAAARELLAAKANLRLLVVPVDHVTQQSGWDLRCIDGGVLVQQPDNETTPQSAWRVTSRREPTAREWRDLAFAWQVVRAVKSNAIVYAAAGATVGVGAGQMSRVDSARIAREKAAMAGLSLRGAAMASDAFFPFPDSVEQAAAAGVTAIVQPGGSKRDEQVIAAADAHDIAMVFTDRRHFHH